jgi:hypothetical protein
MRLRYTDKKEEIKDNHEPIFFLLKTCYPVIILEAP